MTASAHRWHTRGLAAVAGIVAVGNTFVDLTPEWLKSFAIRTFGENDKLVLLLGMGPC